MKSPDNIYRLAARLILFLCCALSVARAQSAGPEAGAIPPGETRSLTLREAVEMALANNNDVEIARKQSQLAQFDIQAARGAYDLRVSLTSQFDRQRAPGTNIFNSGANSLSILSRSQSNGAQFEKAFPFAGARLKGELTAGRAVTNDPFNVFRISNQTALSFSLLLPLARGRGFDEPRRQIEIARRNLALGDQQFRQRVIEIVAAVQRAYWDLAFALKHLQAQQDALRDTQLQLDHVRRLIGEGRLAPVEAVAVEAQIARFDKDRHDSATAVERAQNELKRMLARDERETVWQQTLSPSDDADFAAPRLSLPEALDAAFSNRVELRQAQTAQSLNQVNQRFLREQAKPQIDLTAGYGLNGFAGRPAANASANLAGDAIAPLIERLNLITEGSGLAPLKLPPVAPPPRLLTGGYGQSLENLLRNRFNEFRVGVAISLPLRNTTAKAELGRAQVEAEKLVAEQRQLTQSIHVEVRNALQEMRGAEAKVRASEAFRSAAARALESERRKLDAGHASASVNLLLERQKQLAQSQSDALQARTELNKAFFELQRAMGVALESFGIALP